jgi:hypothetical protein
MDDIYDFYNAKNKGLNVGRYYCLQPVIMKQRQDLDYIPEGGQPETGYEVVDGQQRLTTVFILLKVLGYPPPEDSIFRISFERDDNNSLERESFLYSIDKKTIDECKKKVDFHYFHKAFMVAKKWLEDKTNKMGSNPRQNFLLVLLDFVQVIWYELPINIIDARPHFRNINAGRIQLTEAELVKAMMLNSKYYKVKNTSEPSVHSPDEELRMKQERIARIWDDCGRSLQEDAFWRFITCDLCPRSQRMDFLLKLYWKGSPLPDRDVQDDSISTHFEYLLTDENAINDNWKGILELFRKIQDWFGDVSLYNYIGLLINYYGEETNKQNTLLELIEESSRYTKPEFRELILGKFISKIKVTSEEFSQMNFYEDKTKIKWMLMLFNIRLMNNLGRRFEFAARNGWSVEHVFAKESVKVNESDRNDWINRHLRVVESKLKDCDESQANEIASLRDQMKKFDKNSDFSNLFDEYLRLIEKPKGDNNAIGNLALLGLEENIKLQNDSFFDKRKKIIGMIEEGRNLPVGTERIFLKSFPETGTNLDYWNVEDGERYLSYMQKIIFDKKGN